MHANLRVGCPGSSFSLVFAGKSRRKYRQGPLPAPDARCPCGATQDLLSPRGRLAGPILIANPLAVTPGTRLGPYEILSALGAGGMGEVYRATDTNLKRQVALKVLPASLAGDADRLARFQREAEVLAALNHPNIAAIYGLERTPDCTALVMELVEGEDLSQRIARGAIPLDDALPIAKQIADALEAAHEQGIIHRDLKPANIKVRPDGAVKVLDFGLAKAMEPAGSSPSLSMSPTITTPAMTQLGMILGTAAYMSPEQAKGRTVDRRADVWAFGVVLFEMLTGTRAFEGEGVPETLARVIEREPDWSRLPATLSPALRTYLERCLQKDPRQRIRDIGDVRLALEGAFDGRVQPAAAVPQSARAARPLWARAVPLIVAVLLTAVAVAAIAWSLRPASPPAALARFSFSVPESQTLTTSAGGHAVAISLDGTHIVYAANQQLYLRRLAEMEARPIPGTLQGAEEPFFSPDGKWVAFYSSTEHKIKKIAIAGGLSVGLCDADRLFGANWAEDDRIYFGQGFKGILRVSANGGKPDTVFKGKSNELAYGPQLLPDDDALLFTLAVSRTLTGWNQGQIVVQSLKSGNRTIVLEGGSDARYVPTGHIVYAVGSTLLAVPFDVQARQVRGGSIPVIEDARRVPTGTTGAAQFSVSKIGSMVYVPGDATEELMVALIDRAGTRTPLSIPPGVYAQPRISPNGEWLALEKGDGSERNIWLYDLKHATPLRRLTFGGTANARPTWTPDSQRIAFRSDRDGDGGLFWQRADGVGTAERLAKTDPGALLQTEAFAPDGKVLFSSLALGGLRSLTTLSVGKDERPQPLIAAWASNSSLSQDGHWLAYNTNETGRDEVYVQPIPRERVETSRCREWGPRSLVVAGRQATLLLGEQRRGG